MRSPLPYFLLLAAALFITMTAHAADVTSADLGVGGHSARLLTSGQSAYRVRDRNIATADVILVKAYTILDDETGRAEMALLADRARAGAKVFVEFDSKGTGHSIPQLLGVSLRLASAIPAHLRPLIEAGAHVIPTHVPKFGDMFRDRDHDKLIVTWKAGEPVRVIMGGMNIGNPYAWSGIWRNRTRKKVVAFRDTDVEISGPETRSVIAGFIAATRAAGSSKLALLEDAVRPIGEDPIAFEAASSGRDVRARYLRADPRHAQEQGQIERLYAQLIDETPSGETVTISNAYFLPTKTIEKAMRTAAARGVRFRIVANAPDVPERAAQLVALAFRDALRRLQKKMPPTSLVVIEWSGDASRNEGAIHQKTAKFGDADDAPVIVGSANLDHLSARHNAEAVVVMRHKRIGQQFNALINRQLRDGNVHTVDARALQADSWKKKAAGLVLNRILGRFL